jgi:hypothetical protein
MRLLRTKAFRIFADAIMLVAALAVVWHGAMSLVAHPLGGGGHESAVAMLASPSGHSHHHADGASGDHATHEHSKSKLGGDCCSAVSALTLPTQAASMVLIEPPAMIRPVPAVLGDGIAPATPGKPPRPSYQS